MKMIIGGKKVDSSDGGTIEVINPATGDFLDEVPAATDKDIAVCMDAAQEGKKIWNCTSLHERVHVMEEYAKILLDHVEELAELQCKELGRPIEHCRGEIIETSDFIKSFAEAALHKYGKVMPDSLAGFENDIIFTRQEPLGVVLCIIPFNYPPALYAYKIAPAIVMGNAVIVKPPSSNPLTTIRLVELFQDSGIPGSVIQVITARGSVVSEKIVSSKLIDAVTFTGSTETGIEVFRNSADSLHRVFLELGGNDPLIVFEDADIDYAVEQAYIGRITNAGQICSSDKRFIVQNSVKKEFIEKLVKRLNDTVVGDPMNEETQMGCLISEKAAMEVERKVDYTVEQGAKCVCGGRRYNKTFYEPTLLDNVTPYMDIARDMEVFGPVFPVIEFENEEEAINIANNSVYGLSGGIITKDTAKGLRVASKIECGTLTINGSGNYRHKDHAFGGYKMSGIGREGISVSLEEMSQTKTYALKNILCR